MPHQAQRPQRVTPGDGSDESARRPAGSLVGSPGPADARSAAHGTEQGGIVELLAEQCGLYRRLRELALRQRGLIAGDRPDALLAVLQERQELVRAVTRINERLAPLRREWDARLAELPPDARRRAGELLDEMQTLLGRIIDDDRQDGALLAARKQVVADVLSGLSGGRAAQDGYARGAARPKAGSADWTG